MARADFTTLHARATRAEAPALVVARVVELLERAREVRDPRVEQLIELDAVLRGSILRLVRCPVYVQAATEGRTARLLERLAPDVLADTFRAAAPDPYFERTDRAFARVAAWLHGIAVAAAARWISNQGEFEDPDVAYLAGLAHGLCVPSGRAAPALTTDPDVVAELRFGRAIDSAVRRTAGCVPAPGDATTGDEGTERLLDVVSRADQIARDLGFGAAGPGTARCAAEGELAGIAEAIDLEFAHAAALVGCARLPAPAFAEELATREIAAASALAAQRASRRRGPAPLLRLAASHSAIVELRSSHNLQEVFERGLGLVRGGLTFDRVLLIEREHGRDDVVRVRAVSCRSGFGSAGRTLLEIPLSQSGAFRRVLDGGPPQRSERGDETGALRMLGVSSVATAGLRAGSGAVMGALVADHVVAQRDVNDDEVASLALAAGTLGLVLENCALHAEGKTLRALAEKDELTGISNRRSVLDVLRREIDRARRYGKPLSVAMIDVDHFKTWNDRHGHQAGDVVLQTVAQLISSCSREIDACGRYGGEEFLVVLPETPPDHASLYAERLRATVETQGAEFAAAFPGSGLTVSIGVAHLLARGDDADQVIQRADRALYQAKADGRNRVCTETPQPARA